jgi:hypothetical protein
VGALLAVASTFPSGPLHFGLLCLAAMATGAGTNVGMLTIQRTAGQAAVDTGSRAHLQLAGCGAFVFQRHRAGGGRFMIDAAGFRAAYGLLLLLPLATLLSARAVPHLRRPARRPMCRAARTWDLLRAPGLKRLLVVNWLLSMCWDVHTFAVPILGHERGFSASTIGLILGTFTLSVTLIRMLIPLFAQRLRPVLVLRSAMLGTGVVFALYPLAPALADGGLRGRAGRDAGLACSRW